MKTRSLLKAYFIFNLFITAAAEIYLLSIPRDPKNQLLFGLSLARMVITIVFLLFAVLMIAGLYKILRKPDWFSAFLQPIFSRKRCYFVSLSVCLGAVLLGWFGSFTPADTYPSLEAYLIRIKPVFYWLNAVSLVSVLTLALSRREFHPAVSAIEKPGPGLSSGRLPAYTVAAFGLMLLVWVFIYITGIGLTPISFWQKTGVPILSGQAFWIWVIGLVLILITGFSGRLPGLVCKRFVRSGSHKSMDMWIFLGIWIAAAILWNLEPLPHSHFAPGPFPPDYQNYPYSDAAVYDTCAEFALIGQGLCNLQYADKPLYSFFLIILHILTANRFDLLILLQVCFLALIPPILYLLGSRMHSR